MDLNHNHNKVSNDLNQINADQQEEEQEFKITVEIGVKPGSRDSSGNEKPEHTLEELSQLSKPEKKELEQSKKRSNSREEPSQHSKPVIKQLEQSKKRSNTREELTQHSKPEKKELEQSKKRSNAEELNAAVEEWIAEFSNAVEEMRRNFTVN